MNTNMVAVSLFWNTNMAEVMSCENALQLKGKRSVSKETFLVSALPVLSLFYLYFIIHMAAISLS